MFKYVIVVLALIAAALAAPKPILLAAPAASYSYSERIDRPAPASTTYYTAPAAAALLPNSYYAAYQAPLAYSAAYPAYAYL